MGDGAAEFAVVQAGHAGQSEVALRISLSLTILSMMGILIYDSWAAESEQTGWQLSQATHAGEIAEAARRREQIAVKILENAGARIFRKLMAGIPGGPIRIKNMSMRICRTDIEQSVCFADHSLMSDVMITPTFRAHLPGEARRDSPSTSRPHCMSASPSSATTRSRGSHAQPLTAASATRFVRTVPFWKGTMKALFAKNWPGDTKSLRAHRRDTDRRPDDRSFRLEILGFE